MMRFLLAIAILQCVFLGLAVYFLWDLLREIRSDRTLPGAAGSPFDALRSWRTDVISPSDREAAQFYDPEIDSGIERERG